MWKILLRRWKGSVVLLCEFPGLPTTFSVLPPNAA